MDGSFRGAHHFRGSLLNSATVLFDKPTKKESNKQIKAMKQKGITG